MARRKSLIEKTPEKAQKSLLDAASDVEGDDDMVDEGLVAGFKALEALADVRPETSSLADVLQRDVDKVKEAFIGGTPDPTSVGGTASVEVRFPPACSS